MQEDQMYTIFDDISINSIKPIKKKILIIEDNEMNREILTAILEDEYEIISADNGEKGLDLLSEFYRELSLVLLDVYMPVLDGFGVLKRIQKDSLLSKIPVIVTTGSDNPDDEVRCLYLGASDFITKPYNRDVVVGRIHSIIKLRESEATLSKVEYDELTGVYTMPAFYHHAGEILKNTKSYSFSLAVADIRAFKLINSIFGEKKGNEVLVRIGECFRTLMPYAIIGRHGDKFFALYESHHNVNKVNIDKCIKALRIECKIPNLKIKYSLYKKIDNDLPISLLCDRALIALASIKDESHNDYIEYNDEFQKQILNNQKMEFDFDDAIEKEEFKIWYQPKIDVKTGCVVGAEALVRWIKEDGKLIPPNDFIPLFEKNGMICKLDKYIFKKICEYQKRRIEGGKEIIPISVNMSRATMYNQDTLDTYYEIINSIGIPMRLVPIELTESTTMEGSEISMRTNLFSRKGFALHMDDFGTGYSSMVSLTSLPFEIIKLDKSLIEQIGSSKGNVVINHMISIVHEFGMKVVAEGVDNKAQFNHLKEVGCDQIQGYYFSPPIEESAFEEMADKKAMTMSLDLDREYRRANVNTTSSLVLNDDAVFAIEHIAQGMQEGFLVYRANSDETILFANKALVDIFGCDSYDDFLKYTRKSFKGIVHPNEYKQVEEDIFHQISLSKEDEDYVEYHIIKKDGTIGYVKDFGHYTHTNIHGNVFYVFIKEIK